MAVSIGHLCRALTRIQVSTVASASTGLLQRGLCTRTAIRTNGFAAQVSLTERVKNSSLPTVLQRGLLMTSQRPLQVTSQCPFSTTPRAGATLLQMWRKGPHKIRKRKHVTFGKPQIKGVVLKTLIKKPKKPNSANRKCVRVRLSNGREVTAYIPGEGHSLQEHNIVLLRGGRVQDLPGVKHKVIRGKYDLPHVKK